MQIRNLMFRYDRDPVLRDVTVEAECGRITAVIGPNAAGKSTLLRCIVGALRPTSGQVCIDGYSAHRLAGRSLAERIAYVPQRSNVAAAFTVREVVELGRYALPPDSSRVDDALACLDLHDLASRPFPELSVGQQQLVTLARAFAQFEPGSTLVLDEPTSAMDLHHARTSYQLLRRQADAGATVLIALHDITSVAAIADDVWLLDEGRLATAGRASDVLEPARLESVFCVPFERLHRADGNAILTPLPPSA